MEPDSGLRRIVVEHPAQATWFSKLWIRWRARRTPG
jgi:hypothetical protein